MRRALALCFLGAVLVACDDGGDPAAQPDASGSEDAATPDSTDDAGTTPDATTDGSTEEVDASPPIAWCEGDTAYRWDPVAGEDLETFPDDFHTLDAPDSPTGLRLHYTEANAPWIPDMPDLLRGSFQDMNLLSGFGRNAGAVLRFTAPLAEVPTGAEASVTSDALMLLDLETEPPTRVPYEAWLNEDAKNIVLWPLRPFRPGTRHAVVATTGLLDAEGGCVSPSPALRDVLTGQAADPALERLEGRYADLLERTGLDAADISAATVFTTHADLGVVLEAAADVKTRDYAWTAPPTCEDEGDRIRCEGTFEAFDYRDGRHVETPTPEAPWELPVSVWLPAEGEGPFPVVLAGHGINGRRGHGKTVAGMVVPDGFAVVAADAMEHGDHPSNAPEEDDELDAMKFLGLSLESLTVDALALRGNFNQTLLDRLQVVELIRDAPDVDGDGEPDLDVSRLGYHGTSLGGMMGPPLLAATDDVDAAVLTVAGGRLLVFATDTEQVKQFEDLIINLVGSRALFERLLVVGQTVVDAADPATFGAHVLTDRRVEGNVPDVLFPVAIEDETVPPAAGKALARAMGIPHVGEVLDEVALLPRDTLPVEANVDGSGTTAGFFQYDRVGGGSGATAATHDNTPFSPECRLQSRHFFRTWLDTGTAELLDPYEELSTPPLP
ncbi:MAG: hypothetical protein ACQEXJ_06555 [Myxococcota bacterium]